MNPIAVDVDGEATNDDIVSHQEDFEFLKTVVIDESNIDVVKTKLAKTSEYRRQMIRENESLDLLENFPYFFHTPKLVRNYYSHICYGISAQNSKFIYL